MIAHARQGAAAIVDVVHHHDVAAADVERRRGLERHPTGGRSAAEIALRPQGFDPYRQRHGARQLRQEKEPALKQPQQNQLLARVRGAELPAQLADAGRDGVGGEKRCPHRRYWRWAASPASNAWCAAATYLRYPSGSTNGLAALLPSAAYFAFRSKNPPWEPRKISQGREASTRKVRS